MKIIKNIMLVGLVALFAMNCKNETNPEVKTVEIAKETANITDPNAIYAKAEFTIEGMTCAMGCAKTIEKKIAKMEGVKSATVDFDKKLAMVEYDEAKVTPALLENTVTKVSDTYKVSNMKTDSSGNKAKCQKDCSNASTCAKTAAEKAACASENKKACCSEKKSA